MGFYRTAFCGRIASIPLIVRNEDDREFAGCFRLGE
jgi:hypothetical protein